VENFLPIIKKYTKRSPILNIAPRIPYYTRFWKLVTRLNGKGETEENSIENQVPICV
jgi:hypothetical protein